MKHQQGFTVIELAVVLTIVGLLIASLLVPLSTQIHNSRTEGNYELLTQTKQALISYAIMNKRLPCPASQKEIGKEDMMMCGQEGYFPWADLGVGQSDAWGYPLRYRIDDTYPQGEIPHSVSTTRLAIEIQEGTIISDVVAIIFSYGKDGQYALNQNSFHFFPEAFANTLLDLNGNGYMCDLGKLCYNVQKNASSSSDNEFVWLTQSVLMEQIIAAGNFTIATSSQGCLKQYLSKEECKADLKGKVESGQAKICDSCSLQSGFTR